MLPVVVRIVEDGIFEVDAVVLSGNELANKKV